MKQILCSVLLALSMILSLVSCGGTTPETTVEPVTEDRVPTGERESDSAELPEGPLSLEVIADGRSDYVIVYPAGDTGEQLNAENLQSKIEKYFGTRLKVATDEQQYPCVIAVGRIDRDAVREATVSMREKDWVTLARPDTVILAGGNSESTKKAVTNFLDTVVYVQGRKNATGLSLTVTNETDRTYLFRYNVPADYQLGGVPLREYTIVYNENDLYSFHGAACLREVILDKTGFRLDFRSQNEGRTDHEILVGMTNRTTLLPGQFTFDVEATGGHLQIAFTGMHAKEQACDFFEKQVLVENGISVNDGYRLRQDISSSLTLGEELVLSAPGDIRLAVSNIQASGENYQLRMNFLTALFEEYAPDAVGLQEAGPVFARTATDSIYVLMQMAGYQEIRISGVGDRNYTPILYRPDRLTVLHSGYLLYGYSDPQHPSVFNNGNSKSITWAHFRVNETGKEFVFFSTHCYYGGEEGDTVGAELALLDNARELSELCEQLRQEYSCPIFGGGDMNFTQSSDAHQYLIGQGFANARNAAQTPDARYGSCGHEAVLNTEYRTFIEVPSVSASLAGEIDMIFGYGEGYSFLTQNIMTDDFACYASDHCPCMTDIRLS